MSRSKKKRQAHEQYWIGYCRKSTESEDKQVNSLQDQGSLIAAYYERLPAAEKDRRPLRLLQEAKSAYHPGRPIFQSILQMAAVGQVHGVIVVHPNRVSRNHADSGAFVQRLVDEQISCLDTTGGKRYTGADSNDIFMLTLEGAMSWKDSRDKGDRILQAMRMRVAEGKHMGQLRTGYRRVYLPDGTKRVEIVPEIAALIHQLFGFAETGMYSTKALATVAWDIGLRSRTGKKLGKSLIHAMLRDPLYKGYIKFDGVEAKGVHEPIVEEAVWNRVQQVLGGRHTRPVRPSSFSLRDLFVFGNLLRCPKCGRSLVPYRAKKQYVYYECKNPEIRCRVSVGQESLIKQLPGKLTGVFLSDEDLTKLRDGLLRRHRQWTRNQSSRRKVLNVEYEKVQQEIADVFAERKKAEALGVQDAVDLRLSELKRKRDQLQWKLNATHEKGTEWIEKVIRAFELVNLLQEAILYGSRQLRETALKAIVSNCSVEDKKLVLKLKSPFRESARKGGRPLWYSELDANRTEIEETCQRLEVAYSLLQATCS